MFATLRAAARRSGLLTAAVLLTGGAVAPAAMAQDTGFGRPDLDVSVEITDQEFVLGQSVPFTVTITNNGTAVATGVTGGVSSTQDFYVPVDQWGEFSQYEPGGTIEPGGSVVLHLQGQSQNGDGGLIVASAYASTRDEANFADNSESFLVNYVPTSVLGDLGGVVFGDGNGNGIADRGEGLAGVLVQLYGWGSTSSTTTGADGSFGFADLPSRLYTPYFSQLPDGWIVSSEHEQPVAVNGNIGPTDLQVPAVRPLADTLHASIEFAQDEYAGPDDLTRMTLTLRNTGSTAIEGIIAGCHRSDEGPHVLLGPEWSPFGPSSPGVTVEAGQTRQFELTGIVPGDAGSYGYVFVSCDFGNDEAMLRGFPTATDYARVPGQAGDASLVFYEDRDGDWSADEDERIEHLKIGLVDVVDGRIAGKLRTDSAGQVAFTDLRAGLYQVRIYGPWTEAWSGTSYVVVGNCWYCGGEQHIQVRPA